MKLLYSSSSPYARKARMLIIEKDIGDMVELVRANPLDPNNTSEVPNPLSKVPTLILDDGTALFDSPVICGYLDDIGNKPRLMPVDGHVKWRTMRAQALGDGVLDAAFNTVMEMRRTDAEQSVFWIERWKRAIDRALAEIAGDLKNPQELFDLGHITYACALGYLDFRLPEIEWRRAHSGLSRWHEEVSVRKSYTETRPE